MSMPSKLGTHFEVPEHDCEARLDDETVCFSIVHQVDRPRMKQADVTMITDFTIQV